MQTPLSRGRGGGGVLLNSRMKRIEAGLTSCPGFLKELSDVALGASLPAGIGNMPGRRSLRNCSLKELQLIASPPPAPLLTYVC